MSRKKSYVLSPTARKNLREAKSYRTQRPHEELAGGTGLLLYPVREHYLVYEPLSKDQIVIVAVLRQGRDIPTILNKGKHAILRELAAFRKQETD